MLFFLRSLKENKCIIYLFLARLRPCRCVGSSRVEASELLIAVASRCRARALGRTGSGAAALGLQSAGSGVVAHGLLGAPWHVGSSQTRD